MFSTDYDAPVSESGSVNHKYVELRDLLSEMVPKSMFRYPLPPIPSPVPTAEYGDVKMTLYISLLSTLQYVPVSYMLIFVHNVADSDLWVSG